MKLNKKVFFKIFKKILLFVFGVSFIAAVVVFVNSSLFKIKKVDCVSGQDPCESELRLEVLSQTLGKNWLFFKPRKDAQVKKIFPDSLIIIFPQKEPVAVLKIENSLFVVDENGKILNEVSAEGLPVIKEASGEIVGWITQLVKELKLRTFRPMTVSALGPISIVIFFEDGLEVIFSNKKDQITQLDSLQLIFARAKIEGKKMAKIDLRFNKPVVIYE